MRETLAGLILAAFTFIVSTSAQERPPEPAGYRMEDYRAPVPATLAGARVLVTAEAEAIWRERILGAAPTGSNLYADSYQMYMAAVRDWVTLLHDRILGTTNVIVRDSAGDIASAVSTSGWGFKWPGRVGDSPIIGAGNYADNRYGAAACTGRGEMAMRAATAFSIVRYMRDGLVLDEALRRAMLDLRDLHDPFAERVNVMNAVAMDRDGQVAAISTAADTFYVFQTLDMSEPQELARACVPLNAPD